MIAIVVTLVLIFGELSLLAFGGGNTILPDMRRQIVDVHQWMTNQQFTSLFALAQAAPGPNLMIVPLVGWHVGGLAGLLGSSIAMFGPSSLVTCAFLHVWERFKAHPLRIVVQAGLVPVTAGLIAASAIVITQASTRTWPLAAVAVASAGLTLATRIHPVIVLALGALIGLTGLGQN